MSAASILMLILILLTVVVAIALIEYFHPFTRLVFRFITPKLVELKQQAMAQESPFPTNDTSLWIAESERAFAIKDFRPRAPHHYLIIPKQRLSTLLDCEPALLGEMLDLCRQVAKEAGIADDGFRIVINTNPHGLQTVYHLHMHVLGGRQMRLPIG